MHMLNITDEGRYPRTEGLMAEHIVRISNIRKDGSGYVTEYCFDVYTVINSYDNSRLLSFYYPTEERAKEARMNLMTRINAY